MKLVVAAAVVLLVASAASVAAATDGLLAGTTTTTRCSVSHGTTKCVQTVVITRAGNCFDAGLRLWSQDEIASVRSYRGNVILPGLAGADVQGGYGAAVRPHSKLLLTTRPHAFGSSFPVEDESCS